MNRPRRWAALGLAMLAVSALAVGCATSEPASRASAAPRVRCLDDGARGSGGSGDRGSAGPLFFLFCIQSP